MPNWNHYEDQELKPIFSKRFIEECLDAAFKAGDIKDENIKLKVLKNRAKDSLKESLEAYKEYREQCLSDVITEREELQKYREPIEYDEMVSELKERYLRACSIKETLSILSQEENDFPTREQMTTALNKNKAE